jgi:hypothetical protein
MRFSKELSAEKLAEIWTVTATAAAKNGLNAEEKSG